ncbi:YdcF family protein [Chroococcidiopsis sp. FACHB-1243]|uniref:YdcF family protein n=1 Tax=Chroococcidiopsis sp. [FACHB-1243] TaxID=2692781 RepID=UPI0017854360|nr:YdcF family protein [Chroococcidiopsis sp. [FACHB-1243]]MBD2308302.1 YdcF family protein [Chroococcidiopsis sp. [FACHB-1243]]
MSRVKNASSSKKQRFQYKRCRFVCLSTAAVLFVLFGIIPLRLAIALYQTPLPQAIIALGGDPIRETFAVDFALQHPPLEIWISSPYLKTFDFPDPSSPRPRIYIDRRAVDTVTNFTSLVADFKQRYFQHVYLITSDFHMARAKAIAFFVFGSQGIAVTPISVPSNQQPESWFHICRDVCRTWLWMVTGRTGASLKSEI